MYNTVWRTSVQLKTEQCSHPKLKYQKTCQNILCKLECTSKKVNPNANFYSIKHSVSKFSGFCDTSGPPCNSCHFVLVLTRIYKLLDIFTTLTVQWGSEHFHFLNILDECSYYNCVMAWTDTHCAQTLADNFSNIYTLNHVLSWLI